MFIRSIRLSIGMLKQETTINLYMQPTRGGQTYQSLCTIIQFYTCYYTKAVNRQSEHLELEMENEQNFWIVLGNDVKITLIQTFRPKSYFCIILAVISQLSEPLAIFGYIQPENQFFLCDNIRFFADVDDIFAQSAIFKPSPKSFHFVFHLQQTFQ